MQLETKLSLKILALLSNHKHFGFQCRILSPLIITPPKTFEMTYKKVFQILKISNSHQKYQRITNI